MTSPAGQQLPADAATEPPVTEVLIEPDGGRLARAAAVALIARLAGAQAAHKGTASLVLTGGGVGIAVLRRVAALTADPERDQERVDWRGVDIWWGDERFVPARDEQRNELAARNALLDPLRVPDYRIHAMPASDGRFAEPEDAAAWYAEQLVEAAPSGQALPRFDVLLLGMGPEGHVASIFPGSPAADDERPVLAVRDCPKPPPTRVSLGFSAINSAAEVWLLVAGEDKSPAVALALSGGGARSGAEPARVPAGGVHGTRATRWLLDAAAASRLPPAPPG